jgi:hypothetical protein
MSLSSLGLAYGLIQRGLFRDVDYIEEKRQVYRRLIERDNARPIIGEEFEYEEPDEVNDFISENRFAKHILDEYRMLYELKEIFADDFEDESSLQNFLSQVYPKSKLSVRGLKLKGLLVSEPRLYDYVVAPEQTAKINAYRLDGDQHEVHLREVIERLNILNEDIASMKRSLNHLPATLKNYEMRKAHAIKEHERNRALLFQRKELETMKFTSAFSIGKLAHIVLKDELVPNAQPISVVSESHLPS